MSKDQVHKVGRGHSVDRTAGTKSPKHEIVACSAQVNTFILGRIKYTWKS